MLNYLGLFDMLNYMRIRNDAKLPLGYICMAACYYFKCYGVQAHSAHHTIGQQIQEMSRWGKEYNFIQRAGRLKVIILLEALMSGSFMDQRWREARKQSKRAI